MSKNNNYTIPLLLAGIGLLLFKEKNNRNSTKEFIGEYGYSEIEIWILRDTPDFRYQKNWAKEFLKLIDIIRRKFGFQELGEVYTEQRIKNNTKKFYLVTSVKDDELDGQRLRMLWLREIIKRFPAAKIRMKNNEFGIRIIKNAID